MSGSESDSSRPGSPVEEDREETEEEIPHDGGASDDLDDFLEDMGLASLDHLNSLAHCFSSGGVDFSFRFDMKSALAVITQRDAVDKEVAVRTVMKDLAVDLCSAMNIPTDRLQVTGAAKVENTVRLFLSVQIVRALTFNTTGW